MAEGANMEGMPKKILFVINTLGRAGAEMALLGLLTALEGENCELYLYVLLEQGELLGQIPPSVKLLNDRYAAVSVHTKEGVTQMKKSILRASFSHGSLAKNFFPMTKRLWHMIRQGKIRSDKLLWKLLSDGAKRLPDTFDLAVAFLEGGSTYYVGEHVKARRKAAFVHIPYQIAGYSKELDGACYEYFDRIFPISESVKENFLEIFPEYADKTRLFHNFVNPKWMWQMAEKGRGFTDDFAGLRILSVGRLMYQKGYNFAVDAMALLKAKGLPVRWYVLGEGDEREKLEAQIKVKLLTEDFLLLGATDNPYPYYAKADLYVHITRFEGKSVAIQEAQVFGLPIVASDCDGNKEQIIDGVDGLLCEIEPEKIQEAIERMVLDQQLRTRLGAAAASKKLIYQEDLQQLLTLCE
jgi:glycosyltransferase involved in cell wall biosynthesis